MDRIIYYSWNDFEFDIPRILSLLKESIVDGVYGIPRGGLVLAVRLSYELNVPLILGGPTSATLVVDGICDTGKSMTPFVGRQRIITLYKHKKCPIIPDIWLHENEDWVSFAWENTPKQRVVDYERKFRRPTQ